MNSEKPDPLVSARTGQHWRSSHSTVEQSDRLQMVLGAMDTFPSRYGVAIRRQTKGTFLHRWLCRSKAMQWLRDHQATGSFINAGDWKGARQAMSGCIATRRGQTKRLASCGFESHTWGSIESHVCNRQHCCWRVLAPAAVTNFSLATKVSTC